MQTIQFIAYGIPQPKGSTKSFVVKGKDGKHKAVTTSDNEKLKPWHVVVSDAARQHRPDSGLLSGPIELYMVFRLIRPKSVTVKKRPLPTVKPDVDKLARGVCDALKGTIYGDDAQVTTLKSTKVYADPPGVVIAIKRPVVSDLGVT